MEHMNGFLVFALAFFALLVGIAIVAIAKSRQEPTQQTCPPHQQQAASNSWLEPGLDRRFHGAVEEEVFGLVENRGRQRRWRDAEPRDQRERPGRYDRPDRPGNYRGGRDDDRGNRGERGQDRDDRQHQPRICETSGCGQATPGPRFTRCERCQETWRRQNPDRGRGRYDRGGGGDGRNREVPTIEAPAGFDASSLGSTARR